METKETFKVRDHRSPLIYPIYNTIIILYKFKFKYSVAKYVHHIKE